MPDGRKTDLGAHVREAVVAKNVTVLDVRFDQRPYVIGKHEVPNIDATVLTEGRDQPSFA